MSQYITTPPLSLYIHMPWCIKKCPYCDFNSHQLATDIPEQLYIQALLEDFSRDQKGVGERVIESIFIGGGTPSLFSAAAISHLLAEISQRQPCAANMEVTMEANPGAVEQSRLAGYRAAGVNRLSLGVQSFQDDKLQRLGRIHDGGNARQAIAAARAAGFDNFNIDIMHGLPQQNTQDAVADLQTALGYQPNHLSWYQLTIEPNTVFYKRPPLLPADEQLAEIEAAGEDLLAQHGYQRYEVSAYSLPDKKCRHNENYWLFGDYLGIGAGAHGKLTESQNNRIQRTQKVRHPQHYLRGKYLAQSKQLTAAECRFEFMLNALRLYQPIPLSLFAERTGVPAEDLQPSLNQAYIKGLLTPHDTQLIVSPNGRRYLNDLVELFLH